MGTGNSRQTVSLGCGTLIVIGLIVMFFSNPSTGGLKQQVKELRGEIAELKESVDAQTDEIHKLQHLLEEKLDEPLVAPLDTPATSAEAKPLLEAESIEP